MHLLDANVFIEAANRYYAIDICPGFWSWLDTVCPHAEVFSIRPVYREVAGRSDELAKWVRARRDDARFLAVDDDWTQRQMAAIVRALEKGPQKPEAKRKFLDGADPWLVAKALTKGATVVTHETVVPPETRKRVSLANVCRDFEVPYINTFALLRHHGAAFHL